MRMMMNDVKKTGRSIGRGLAIAAVAGFAAAASPAVAQDYDYDSWEWESDLGVHEEEWYDPTDWFDDEPYDDYNLETIDYEFGEGDYDGYYDGYYDGFEDDDFGYDYWDSDWDNDYSTTYSDGYYDGYYDQQQNYEYDPQYYVVTYEDPNRQYDRNRDRDQTRVRGDRGSDRQDVTNRDRQHAAKKMQSEKRLRGTVANMQEKRNVGPQNHLVYMVRFEDGDVMHIDLGPKMTKQRFPLESGDRATFIGDPVRKDDTKVLLVKRMSHEGDTYNLRGSKNDQRMNSRNKNRDSMNRDQNRNQRNNDYRR